MCGSREEEEEEGGEELEEELRGGVGREKGTWW